MKLRKAAAVAVACTLAVSSMAFAASAENMEEGVFIIGFGDADWKASFWGKDGDILDSSYETTAAYTGDGTYTVTLDLSSGYENESWIDEETGDLLTLTTGNGIGAMGIQIYGEDYANLGVNILSVKFDGVDFPLTGVSYTNDEDGGRRTNIYNAWAGYDASKEDHVTLDPDSATSTLIDIGSLGEWSVCEVTFEAYTVGGEDAAEEAADEVDEAPAEEEAAAETEAEETEAVAEETTVAEAAAPEETAAEETAAPEETVEETAAPEPAAETGAAPAETTPAVATGDVSAATTSSKGSPDTGIADVAAVAGIAVLAAGAVVVAKKRK